MSKIPIKMDLIVVLCMQSSERKGGKPAYPIQLAALPL
jgi:hypothetical protein